MSVFTYTQEHNDGLNPYWESYMRIRKLKQICCHIRLGLENIRCHKPPGCFTMLQYFPTGCCKITSNITMYYLAEYEGIPNEHLSLMANAQIGDASHAWVRYQNIHIDLTADQFGKPNVIVSSINPWPGSGGAPYPFRQPPFLKDYEARLLCTCEFIELQPMTS